MFKRFSILICFISLLFVSACSSSPTVSIDKGKENFTGQTEYPVTIEDNSGSVSIDKEPERIISLAPNILEILFALDADSRVVGRTEYGNYPPEAESVTSIGGYSDPNVELILAQNPDLIIATDFMADDVKKQLENSNAKVLIFKATSYDETLDIITKIGLAINCNDQANSIVKEMDYELEQLQDTLETKEKTKSVFIDIGDYYTAGSDSFLGNELQLIEATNIAQDATGDYPQLSTEEIIAANPDVYISLYTPVDELKQVAGFDSMTCFKDNQVFYINPDGQDCDMIERPGPRLVNGMEILAEYIYPECFSE